MKKSLLSAFFAVATALGASAMSADNLYVVGSGCAAGWSPENALEMTKITDQIFTWTGELKSSGEFKFLVARDWHPSITCDFNTAQQGNTVVESGGSYNLYERPNDQTGQDNKFQVSVTGNYTLNVDLSSMKMAVTLNNVIEEPLEIYIIGNATAGGWNLDNAMNQKFAVLENGHYSWSGYLSVDEGASDSGCFRFISEKDWWNNSYTTIKEDGNQTVGVGEYDIRFCETRPANEVSFRIETSGAYTIDIDTETLKMVISKKDEELYVIGNATNAGSPLWDLSWASVCVPTGTAHEFEWKGQLFAKDSEGGNAQFKFICQDNDWNPGFVSLVENQPIVAGGTYDIASTRDNSNDWKFTVPADGWYKLIINTETLTVKVSESEAGIESISFNKGGDIAINGRCLSTTDGKFCVFDIMGRIVANNVSETEVPEGGIYVVVMNGKASKLAVK